MEDKRLHLTGSGPSHSFASGTFASKPFKMVET